MGFYPYNESAEGLDVTVENPTGCLFVYGESGLTDSVKICVDDDYIIEVLKYTGAIWNHYVFLNTKEWTEGDSTVQEEWFIQSDRKISVANQASAAKAATFAAESNKWNELSPFIFSWETLPADQDLLIPENHQMCVHGTFTLEGDLHLQGTLAIRD